MARIRTIKPEFFTDGDILKLSIQTRFFYIGLWIYADDNGVLEYDPISLKARIFPTDRVKIEKIIDELRINNKVLVYEVEKKQYLYLKNLKKHQKIDRPRQSNLPKPEGNQMKSSEISRNQPCMGSEGKGSDSTVRDSIVLEIVSDLNDTLKTIYKPTTGKTRELITARLKEGFTLDDFKAVHRKMAKAWGVDNKMRQYLRPQTLYSNKFEAYLNRPEDIPLNEAGARTAQGVNKWLEKQGVKSVGQS